MDRLAPLRKLASAQHSLATRDQARELGISRDALRHGLARGEWDALTARVVALVGAPPDELRRVMAGVLDAGQGAVAGRRTAAALWRVPGFPGDGRVELTRARTRSGRTTSLARIYEVRSLPEHLVTTVHGIPVVSLPYLLFQLAGSERPDRVERALANICTRSPAVHFRINELLPELAERGRNGIVLMRDWLDRNPPGQRVVASGLEGRFERILVEAGEQPLDRQIDVGGHEWIGRIDFVDRSRSSSRSTASCTTPANSTSPTTRTETADCSPPASPRSSASPRSGSGTSGIEPWSECERHVERFALLLTPPSGALAPLRGDRTVEV